MVKDVIVSAMRMAGLDAEADALEEDAQTLSDAARRFLRYYDLVVSEIADEYRRGESPAPAAMSDPEADFYGISLRVLAYGVAAEHFITEGMDEAVTWDGRYRSALALCSRPPVRVKARSFMR